MLQINPNIKVGSSYNLKLLFEELGDFKEEEMVITDSGDSTGKHSKRLKTEDQEAEVESDNAMDRW